MGIVQISAAPDTTDIEDSTSIGVVRDFLSSRCIKGLEFVGPQMVVNLNRVV